MSAFRIEPIVAPPMSRGQKRPRVKAEDHLKWIRTLPCAVCGSRRDVHAAHLRTAALHLGKRGVGIGEKPDDSWSTPLCAEHHLFDDESQHSGAEMAFWKRHGIDPFYLALALHRASGDDVAGEEILKAARGI